MNGVKEPGVTVGGLLDRSMIVRASGFVLFNNILQYELSEEDEELEDALVGEGSAVCVSTGDVVIEGESEE